MKYEIFEEGDPTSLATKVNSAIQLGWKPQGGVASYGLERRDGYGTVWTETWFMQAMTRDVE